MTTEKSIDELVEDAQHTGSLEDLSELIVRLYSLNNDKALGLTLILAMSDFGGITYKMDFQNLAALGALHWGPNGLRRLGEEAIKNGEYRAINNVTRLLSHVSSKSLRDFLFSKFKYGSVQMLDLENEKYKTEEWTKVAKETLVDLVKSVEKEDTFPISIVQNMTFPLNEIAQEHIFAALMARWFNFNIHGLNNYIDLVNEKGKLEIDYQNYLKENPYLLEPFHAQIWSKPRFGEELVPDFLIRSMDNSFTVVEIEQSDFPILTQAGELSAKTTHAKRQALDFRDWAINNHLYASKKYNGIYRPYCLVVIGKESELTELQQQRLKQENESTQGVLKIVGFDWLFNRAKATFDNLIKFGFDRQTFKETTEDEKVASR